MGPRESLQFGHERQSGEEDVRSAGNARKVKQTAFERGRALDARHCVAVIFLKGFLFYLFFFFQMELCKAVASYGGGSKHRPLHGMRGYGAISQPFLGGGGGGEHRDVAKFRAGGGRGEARGGIQLLLFALASEEQTQECLEFGSHQSLKDPDLGQLCS